MKRLRLRDTVLLGVAIGAVTGVGAYGAVSTSVPAPKIALAAADVAGPASEPPAKPAHPAALPCKAHEQLVSGFCVIHKVRTVAVPAQASSQTASASTSSTPRQSWPRYAPQPAYQAPAYQAPQYPVSAGNHDD